MNPSFSHRTVVALTILGVVFIGVASYWYWSAHAHMQARGTAPETAYPGVIASSSPGFDSYTNAHYGFTLDYPSGWHVGDNELGFGTFQIFNYDDAASAGKDFFPPGENKIEMAIITDLDEYNSDDPNWRGSVEQKQIGGETAMYVSDPENQINSYMIPIPSSGGEYLAMSIYGDPKNFAELDSVAASLHWTAAPTTSASSYVPRGWKVVYADKMEYAIQSPDYAEAPVTTATDCGDAGGADCAPEMVKGATFTIGYNPCPPGDPSTYQQAWDKQNSYSGPEDKQPVTIAGYQTFLYHRTDLTRGDNPVSVDWYEANIANGSACRVIYYGFVPSSSVDYKAELQKVLASVTPAF